MRAWSPPPNFEEYSLVRALGHGEMGEVYLAHDNLLDRPVAAKFIASLKQDGHQRTRFMIEARAAARIQHPNVVAVYRVGEIDAHPFLISEFMRGIRLDELETPVPASRALDIAIGLARGLSAAHRKGVLHRDIKPANAMLSEEGIPKLLDFGLAKVTAPSEVEVTADLAETTEVIDAGELLAEALSSSDGAPRASLPPAPTIPPGAPISPSTSAESLLRDLTTRKITREGTIMGTPDYMAPEVWRGEPATMQSDVYSLGAVIFELCAGRTVFAGVAPARLPAHVNEVDPPSLISVAPGTDRRLAEIVDRALRREPTERFLDGEALCAALEALQTTVTPLPMDGPYRGLQPFDANHRAIFLGRESEVRDAMDRLRGGSFLVLAGEAAIGKSSLCRAGIIPLAEELGFEDGRVYKTLQMPPTARPATTAAGLLATALGLPEAAVLDTLRFSPGDLAPLLSQALGEDRGLFWVIDPLDGLLARADSAERDQFEELLARAIALVPGVRVLGVARTENLSRLASLPMLGPHFSRSLYVLRAPSRESLRRVVVEPAERWGVRFESPALVEALVEQAANLPAGLAMLEWVLSTLWEARDEKCGTIRAAALEAMGGVSGAIATHAESVIQALPPNEVANAKQILVRLVDAQGARVRRGQAELGVISEGKEVVLERLLSGGIVTAIAEGAEPSYELSHDLLLRRWPTLRRWLSDDEEIRAVIDRIGRSAGEWLRLGRPRDALWARRQLEEARQVPRAKLQPLEQQFLAASFAAVGRARLLRACLVGSGLLAVVGAYTIAELAAQKRRVAQIASHEQSADLALSRAEAAHKTAGELRLQAIRAFEDGSREPGERAFLEYEGAQHAEDLELRSALGSVETANAIAQQDPRLTRRLGEILYARALLAEESRHKELEDELVSRFTLNDPSGEIRQRWGRPGSLLWHARSTALEASLERWEPELGWISWTTPLHPEQAVELAPGEYRMRLSSGALVPLLVSRGAETVIVLGGESPSPPGFVPVVAGSFVFGSTADVATRRSFFDALPAHTRQLPAFQIARHEVTYGEWIAFLEGLPPAMRMQHTPGSPGERGTTGAVSLARGPDGRYSLHLRVGRTSLRAKAGEPLVYPGRTRNKAVRWEQLPVTAVSAIDAEAYLAWLRQTGQVPGARLCSELEWERAARGAGAREYPHGDRLLPAEANYDLTYDKVDDGMGPDEVGSHPASDSPFGVQDLAGNAFEWTTSALTQGGYVARGGSFFYDASTARTPNRTTLDAAFRDVTLGLRVCTSGTHRPSDETPR